MRHGPASSSSRSRFLQRAAKQRGRRHGAGRRVAATWCCSSSVLRERWLGWRVALIGIAGWRMVLDSIPQPTTEKATPLAAGTAEATSAMKTHHLLALLLLILRMEGRGSIGSEYSRQRAADQAPPPTGRAHHVGGQRVRVWPACTTHTLPDRCARPPATNITRRPATTGLSHMA